MKIAIIGGGFFGVTAAIKIKEKFPNYQIFIYEEKKDILLGASGKNQFRCHAGYHYPRSQVTIQECQDSILDFKLFFKDCFIKSKNYYAISKENSKINFSDYINILEKNNLKYKIENNSLLKNNSIEGIIKVDEKLINIGKVRNLLHRKIKELKINLKLNTKINLNYKFINNNDKIILATYDKNNINLKETNLKTKQYHFQLVEKIIVKVPKIYNGFSCVIIDGPFMCIDPYYKNSYSILGNVKQSVIKTQNDHFYNFDDKYKLLLNNYNNNIEEKSKFDILKNSFSKYFYDFEKVKYHSSFYVVRCTKKNPRDDRITGITTGKKIIQIFSGKWINCMTTANKIVKMLK